MAALCEHSSYQHSSMSPSCSLVSRFVSMHSIISATFGHSFVSLFVYWFVKIVL